MQITLAQLKQSLQQHGLQPLYVLTSNEELLLQETADFLAKIAAKKGHTEKQSYTVQGHFKWQQLFADNQALSLFDEKKIIHLHLPSGKPGQEGAKQLMNYAEHLPPDSVTIIRLPWLNRTVQKSKWFNSLEQKGVVISIATISRQQFPLWLKKRLARHQLSCSNNSLNLIADYCEGNLLAAKQVIERLSLLYESGEISDQDVKDSISDNSRFDIYNLVDVALAMNVQQALNIFLHLKNQQVEPSLILWVLSKDIQLLYQLKTAQAQGEPLASLWKKHAVWSSRQGLLKKHLTQFSDKDYQHLLSLTHQADCALKGANRLSIWAVLENLVLLLSSTSLLATKVST